MVTTVIVVPATKINVKESAALQDNKTGKRPRYSLGLFKTLHDQFN